jgi:hypothetical protein
MQSNPCRFLFLLFSYLRFAEAASFDKKRAMQERYNSLKKVKTRDFDKKEET